MLFGLIGQKLGHSFSAAYFNAKFQSLKLPYHYQNFEIDTIEECKKIFKIPHLRGLNVTIPYKKEILNFLDECSPEIEKIGAVNTILIENGKKIGYNTDVFGLEELLNQNQLFTAQQALILGNGGAAQAVAYVLTKKSIPFQIAARKGKRDLDMAAIKNLSHFDWIFQTTPVGMYPKEAEFLDLPYLTLEKNQVLIDLIYNPIQTIFLQKGKEKGLKTINGQQMLIAQAEKAWEIWKKDLE